MAVLICSVGCSADDSRTGATQKTADISNASGIEAVFLPMTALLRGRSHPRRSKGGARRSFLRMRRNCWVFQWTSDQMSRKMPRFGQASAKNVTRKVIGSLRKELQRLVGK